MERKTAVIIGRFQVPYLHLGHIYLIAYALQKYGDAVILLGTGGMRDERNPYSATHREDIIHRIFPKVPVYILWDKPGKDKEWSDQIFEILDLHNVYNPVLLHSRDSFRDHYKGYLPLEEIPELPGYSGTELRKQTMT
jgi:hypothetical protein